LRLSRLAAAPPIINKEQFRWRDLKPEFHQLFNFKPFGGTL